MKKLNFKKIDAFTKGAAQGNPAGYVLMDRSDTLNEKEMQKLARELKGFVNEVGFVSRQDKEFELKFFSSECEVAFCGHATIAIMYDLISTNSELSRETELKIKVKGGILSVFNHLLEEDAVYIMAPEPKYLESQIIWDEIAQALQTDISSFDREKPFQLIDGGLRTLIVPMASFEACVGLHPHQEKLRQFCMHKDFDIIHVFTEDVSLPQSGYRTRVFAPKYGYLEDPATGSGNSAFCYYLFQNKMWTGDFAIEQGTSVDNPNIVMMKRYEIERTEKVLFGGCAATRIAGNYFL